jgi:hypothetical protein
MSQRNAMVQTMLVPFVMAARECAVQMMSNAMFALEGLDAESKRDTNAALASILVMESAGKMLQAFDAMRRAAESVRRAVQGESVPGVAAE